VYRGTFPQILLQDDVNHGYPIGIKIASTEKSVQIHENIHKLKRQLIPIKSFSSIVFQSIDCETDFMETCGQFLNFGSAKSVPRIVDPNAFTGFTLDQTILTDNKSDKHFGSNDFEMLERCASGILAVSAARRTASIGAQFLSELAPGLKRQQVQFGSLLNGVMDHRLDVSSKTKDAATLVIRAWANVFAVVPESQQNPRDILGTCIEAVKNIAIPKTEQKAIIDSISKIDDFLTSKIAFEPFQINSERNGIEALTNCLTLALMRPQTVDLLDWEYSSHFANEQEFITAAYLTGLLMPRRKHKVLRDEALEMLLVDIQISSIDKNLNYLYIKTGSPLEVTDVLNIKIGGQSLAKPYGSSWNLKKTVEQDLTPKTIERPLVPEKEIKPLFSISLADCDLDIKDGKITIWPRKVI
jgi:hypothetical protein